MNFYLEFIQRNETRILIVQNMEPSNEICSIIDDFRFLDKIKFLKDDTSKMLWVEKANLSKAFAVLVFADKQKEESDLEFIQKQENTLYLCKNIKNEFENLELYLFLYSNMTHWRVADWLDSAHIFYADSFKNYHLANNVFNKSYSNFLSQAVYTYKKTNSFLLPSFLESNPLLKSYRKSFKQNIIQIKLSEFFLGYSLITVKKIIYFSYAYSTKLSKRGNYKANSSKKKNFCSSAITLIAIEQDQNELLIYQPDYLIKTHDIGYFFMDSNPKIIDFIFNFNITDLQEYESWLKSCHSKKKLNIKNKERSINNIYSMIKSCLNVYKNYKIEKLNDEGKIKRRNSNSSTEVNFEEDYGYVNLFKQSPQVTFENHLIIFGEETTLFSINSQLRKISNIPVIFFSQREITLQKWRSLKTYENMFYYYGSFMNLKHIERLDIDKSFKILILPTHDNNRLFPDSDAVMLIRIIKEKWPESELLIEFNEDNSLKFLDKRPVEGMNYANFYNYDFWPNVLNGSVFLNSLVYSYFMKTLYDNSFFKIHKDNEGIEDNFGCEKNTEIFKNQELHTFVVTKEMEKFYQNFGDLMFDFFNYLPNLTLLCLIKSERKVNIFHIFIFFIIFFFINLFIYD